jgi:DNA-binding beta-propeller fold protein YncE
VIERAGADLRGTSVAAMPAAARLIFAAFIAAAMVLVLAPSALAVKKYLPAGQFPPGYPENLQWTPSNFNTLLAEDIAVSDKNHHIYVADSGRGAIFDYSSATDKTPARWNGTETPSGSFIKYPPGCTETYCAETFVSVAVDNTTGDVYVADRSHAVIDKFDENGKLIASFGDSSPTHNGQLAGLETTAKSFSPSKESYTSFPIAIDQATHDLYVVDPGHKVIDVFDEDGTYLPAKQITATPAGLYEEISGNTRTTGIAVTTAGNVYVADWAANEIFQFNAAGEFVSAWNGGTLPNGSASVTPEGSFGEGGAPLEVAAEDSTGDVFVNNWAYSSVDTFDENGNFLTRTSHSELGEGWLAGSEVVAIDQATGYLYSSYYGEAVEILKPVVVPDVTINPASEVTTTSATLNGHVDPATGEGGGPITECRFEYLTVYQYAENGESKPWNGATRVPCSPSPSSSPTDVSAAVTGLTPGTEYRYRLVAANAEGENSASAPAFATVGHYRFSTHFGSAGSGDGQLEEPQDIAVDNQNGDVYVADAGNHRVDQFSSSGSFIRAFGADVGGTGVNVCTSGCQAGTPGTGAGQFTSPKFIEVDNSTGPSTGDVYVADTADSVVQKFDSSGNLIASWGSGGTIEFPKKEGTIGGITVDPSGNLYVLTDKEPHNWTEFSQDGVSRKQFPTNGEWFEGERLSLGSPGGSGIDIGPTENWYETQPAGRGGYGVYYSSPTAEIYQFYGMYQPNYGIELANSGLTIDRATNDLFVDQGTHIDRFAGAECIPPGAGCKPSDSFGTGQLSSAAGLATRPSTGLLYAADSGNNNVAVFSPMPLPEVTTGPATNLGPTSATMTGHVDPAGPGQISDCHFEYLKGPVRDEVQTLEFSKDIKEGTFTLTFEGQTTQPIQYSREYSAAFLIQFRLEELSTIGVGNVHVTEVFRGPFVIEFTGQFADLNVSQISADSSGLIPSGATVTPETRYDGNGWGYAVNVPCSPEAPLSAATDVSAALTNLTPFATYHYRLIATRADGEGLARYGSVRAFTPAPAVAPAVDGTSSTSVTPTTAVLGAQINPNLSPTVYRFQYGIDTSYSSQTPSSESIGEDSTDHSVSAEVTELTPGTTYHFRAVANNLNGLTPGPDQTFTAPDRPLVADSTASDITQTAVTLSAQIKPGFRPTTYHFEYGRTAAYGNGTAESGSIGSDDSVRSASSTVSGLAPAKTYHFRVVASNEIGTAEGSDQIFTTASPTPPPPPKPRAPRCKKGFVKRHGKCVRKRHHVRRNRHG